MQNQKIQFKINAAFTCSVLILQIFDEEGKKELKFIWMMSKPSKSPNKV
jgi:hypothetical protein